MLTDELCYLNTNDNNCYLYLLLGESPGLKHEVAYFKVLPCWGDGFNLVAFNQ